MNNTLKKIFILLIIILTSLFSIMMTAKLSKDYYQNEINKIINESYNTNIEYYNEELYELMKLDKSWNNYKDYIINKNNK